MLQTGISIDLAISDDQYLPGNNVHLTSEIRNWPNIEFDHILTYSLLVDSGYSH